MQRGPVLLMVVFTLAWPSVGRAAVEADRLVCLELIDTDAADADRLGMARDGENLRDTLESIFQAGGRAQRLDRLRLQGAELTPARVLAALKELVDQGRLRPGDTLLVYYSGHGTWRRGHVLSLAHGPLYREDLIQAMNWTGCRLRVLLTDCCSTSGDGRGGPSTYPSAKESLPPPVHHQPGPASWHTLRDLLLRHQGTVDITAALPGRPAYGNPAAGGNFTALFLDLFCTPREELDRDGDGQVDWEELFDRLRQGAANQQAHSFSLPRRR